MVDGGSDRILDIQHLGARYGGGQALTDVTLTVGRECVALMGRNGAGKTTLARAIMGLTPPQPSGSIRLFGEEVVGLPPHRMARRGVGYVPQGRRLFPSLKVDEHLKLTARAGPHGQKWTADRIFEVFPSLARRRHAYGDQLSGGERSMVAIGRALATNPGCLILDEPTEGLAPSVVEDVAKALRLLAQDGVAILLVEQSVRAATLAADRIYMIADGHIVHEAGREVLSDEETLSRHLGMG